MNWRLIGRGLRLTYLLRVPLLTLLVLAAFGPISLSSDLLGNLLDQGQSGWYLFTVSFSAFLLGFTAVTTLNLILHYGNGRFEGSFEQELGQKHPLIVFFSGLTAALILDLCVYQRTIPKELANIGPLLLGALAALALVLLAKIVQLAQTDPQSTPHPPPLLVFPAYLVPPLEHFFDDLYCCSSECSRRIKAAFDRVTQFPLQILRPAGQGYLINLEPACGEDLSLFSGHIFAASLFVIAFASYLAIGLYKSNITAKDARVPALAFVLLFFIVACWALAALTFFFDRYRFPLLWTLILLSLLTLFTPQSDHFFRVERMPTVIPEPLTPAAYLKTRLNGHRKRLILIASPGGGIQAAAWTGQVVEGLEARNKDFRGSVALVSSVSGGSLGSMIYAASFAGKIGPSQVAKNARRSAIDEVAWGWTVPDFWRVLLPWFRYNRTIDRGWALEKKWAAVNQLDDTGGTRGTMLSDWAKAARSGKMPALIINSMLVESGTPVVFSNTRFPATPGDNLRIRNFYDLYPHIRGHFDIRVNTAARLSASFPYVAPAARPNLEAPFGPGYHFVDGGYYDNFGINSLLAWLGEALDDEGVLKSLAVAQNHPRYGTSAGPAPVNVLILQIQHFNPTTLLGPSRAGWGLQLVAPPIALYHMRDFAQASTARNQIEFFAKYYETRNVHVWSTHIDYDGAGKCADAPLSWKLDYDQQQCIVDTWNAVQKGQSRALSCIDDYLAGRDPGSNCENPAVSSR
jgi:predicted acylesterase/phospholipase RssA